MAQRGVPMRRAWSDATQEFRLAVGERHAVPLPHSYTQEGAITGLMGLPTVGDKCKHPHCRDGGGRYLVRLGLYGFLGVPDGVPGWPGFKPECQTGTDTAPRIRVVRPCPRCAAVAAATSVPQHSRPNVAGDCLALRGALSASN